MNLIDQLPIIKRARGFYLYDFNNERILDLFLDNGRAIAGHRPNGLSLAIKNSISRGLYAGYPSIYSARIIKLLKMEFPKFQQYCIYKDVSRFLEKFPFYTKISDPAVDTDQGECSYWRPYLPVGDKCETLLIKFAFPGNEVIAVLSNSGNILPQSDLIPPYILSGLIRSYYDLKKRIDDSRQEDWSLLDNTKHWKRNGPYLVPLCREKEYGELFKMYLDCNILISPHHNIPTICAVGLSEGDLKSLYRRIKEK
ncbi:MAG: hypothetical protein GY760_13755 [Deltaproteobacteria bacterium]|nr:hypothetical protein [Deltaproteobacteria bacterium]